MIAVKTNISTGYICLALAAIAASLLWQYRGFGMRPKGYPPGPPTIPLLGNLHQMPRSNAHIKFREWALQYGPVVSLKLGGQDMILLNSREAVRELCEKKGQSYSIRPDMFIRDFGYNLNILLRDNDEVWRQLRKQYHLRLNSTVADRYVPYQDFETLQLIHDLLVSPADYDHHIKRSTTSFGSTIVYGWRTTTMKDRFVERLFEWAEGFLVLAFRVQLADFYPFLRPIFRRLPTFISNSMHHLRYLTEFEKDLWVDLRDDVQAKIRNGSASPSFCKDMLLSKSMKDTLSPLELAFNAGHAFSGASDTTYQTMRSFVKAMMLYPEAQIRAQVELDKVVGTSRLPNINDVESLPYLRCIVKETLRWMPATPLAALPHAAAKDDIYEGYIIPKGAAVVINAWAINNDPERTPEPRLFKPERFKNDNLSMGDSATRPPEERDMYTFGAGRRICPGIHVAERGLWLSFARILWAFEISPVTNNAAKSLPDDQDSMLPGFVTGPPDFPCQFRVRDEGKRNLINQLYEDSLAWLDENGDYIDRFREEKFGRVD